jgi:CRISPR-associated protein Csh1
MEKIEASGYEEAIRELGLGPQEAALFLLGVLLARVASEQCKKYLPKGERKKSCPKPVLEKVGYQGMPLEKVERFAVELFEKLTEYRRLDANSELVFGAAMEALAREKPRWKLSDEENAFYILLGYGYETRRILQGAAKKEVRG